MTIKETNATGYVTTASEYAGQNVAVEDGANTQTNIKTININVIKGTSLIAITNTKDVTPDTGVHLPSLPYLLILGVVALCGLAWIMRKKKNLV